MNRYVITRQEIKGQEYQISALYDEKKRMIEVLPESLEQSSILGNIYIGRVENIVQNLNAAFVKMSPNKRCYLSLEDVKHPVFTKKLSDKKPLVAGEELLVQVSREALKTKEPAVTTNLSFAGTCAVRTTGNRRIGVSSKLSAEQKRHYQELLKHQDWLTKDCGIIIRTNASELSDEALLAEIKALQERCSNLLETAQYKTCYSLLSEAPAIWEKHLSDLRLEELEEIVTDDRKIFEKLCAKYRIPEERLYTKGSVSAPVDMIETTEHIRLRYYADEQLSLSALYSVGANLEAAIKTRVWLKSGAYILIEHTEALTVIDVNTGKNVAKKGAKENFLKVNLEAAEEIARQLRLRNISGMILVDFINLTDKKAEEELLGTLRRAIRQDPIPTQLIDMTPLGLVELTRKKVRKSLREILGV